MQFRDPFQTRQQEHGMTTTATPTKRLTLTAAESQIILDEYNSYPRGDPRRGALLRRYGLDTSQRAKRRERRKRGDGTLAPARPGPQPVPRNPLADEVAQLTRETARLQQQLTNAETIIAIQKKWRRCWTCCQSRDPTRHPNGGHPRTGSYGGCDGGLSRAGRAAQHLLSPAATTPAPV
jgi:hypothetical protein